MARLPDFVIIGAMKCATSTLHEQLAAQPGIVMSEPKEPNFFSDDDQYARGMAWYQSLFDPAGDDDLCGESSTHYTKLPTYPETVARLKEHVPSARFVYVMRHPVDRLVSHYIHEWTQRVIDVPIGRAIDEHPELIDYSRYTMQLEPFAQHFGLDRVLPVFFDRLHGAPEAELARVCRFIGYDRQPRWTREEAHQNVSAQRMRTSALRDAIKRVPGLRPMYRALLCEDARQRINNFWRMRRRPELSAAQREKLERVFDEDLAQLGQWLGVELSCANFRELTAQRPYEWQAVGSANDE